jgi:transcriptional regulator with XRE-family HTH domain
MTTAELLALLDARRRELGLSHMELGKAAFGREDNSALSNLQRGSSPTLDRLQNICTALGLEVRVEKPRSLQGLSEDGNETDFDAPNLGRQGYLPIPWLDAMIGKGSAPLAFQASWLDLNRLNPERLSAVLPDVSMIESVDPARTVAIIESGAARRGTSQFWCFRETGKIVLARVAFFEDGFVIMPPRFEQAPRVVRTTDETGPHLLGRVACLAVVTAN